MELNDDVWIYIKEYMFHRHLWSSPEIRIFSKVIKQLPVIGKSFSEFDYGPLVVVSSSETSKETFVKVYDMFHWNSYFIDLVNIMQVPENMDENEYIMECTNHTYSSSCIKEIQYY